MGSREGSLVPTAELTCQGYTSANTPLPPGRYVYKRSLILLMSLDT